jgi:hypothetical protein
MAEIQDGWKVTEVADRLGVSRQAVHKWIARYEAGRSPGARRPIAISIQKSAKKIAAGLESAYRAAKGVLSAAGIGGSGKRTLGPGGLASRQAWAA